MPAERFEFEDFELDRSAYELRRAGSAVHLERIPLELLFLLIERRGQLVTRQEIFERIWGKGVFVDTDNSINTAVRKLRLALHDDPDAPRFVVTVPAKGYRFIAPIREEGATAPVFEANPVSVVAEASPTADAADASPPMITRADLPLRKNRRRGILSSIVGIAILIAVIVLIEQLSRRPPTTSASIPPAQAPAIPLPDKPSIAVLPFTNVSGDPQQEYFSDGITNDLITDLARGPDVFVIDRASSSTYKGKPVRVQDVSRELGVKYVLEGAVQKAADQVRISAQLVDATTGAELWAERYNRPMKDIFALQDEIVRRIVTTMRLQLNLWEKHGLLVRRLTDNLEAYDDGLRGVEYLYIDTKDTNEKARQMFEEAIALDPKAAGAYVGLASTYYKDWFWGWNQDPRRLEHAFELAQKAIALDDSNAGAHALLGAILAQKRRYDEAIAEGEHAIALAPSAAEPYQGLGATLDFAGRPAEAIEYAQKAMRLNPKENFPLGNIGFAYVLMGRYGEAVPILKTFLASYPNVLGGHMLLTIAYTELNREAEARPEAAEVLRISPNFSLEAFRERAADKDRSAVERRIADLRKAGLK